jgi:dihydroorotate dehydrogenase
VSAEAAPPPRSSDVGATVTGVHLPFCAMNAAGAASTADALRSLVHSRTGAIVLPTTTLHPFLHPEFRSLHNPGYDKLVPLVRELAADGGRPVVASVAGGTADEFGFLARAFAEAGAAVIELNLADAWVAASMDPLEDVETLAAIATRAASAGVPVWTKLTALPDRPALGYRTIVGVLLDAGVRGVVARNDFFGLERLLLEAPAPIDVVAAGGVRSGYDVARALAKGACAVQVGTALRREGPGVFARLEAELRKARARV